jgi:hypothetical protein
MHMGAIAPAVNPNASNEEVLEIIRKDAEDPDRGGDGAYRLTIRRRSGVGGMAEQLAIFEGVSYAHLDAWPIWIDQLINGGGGVFQATVTRPNAPGLVGGGFLNYAGAQGTAVKPLDYEAIKRPDWRGPTNLVMPVRRPQPDIPHAPSTHTFPGASSQTTPGHGVGGGFQFGSFGSNGNPVSPLPLTRPHDVSEAMLQLQQERAERSAQAREYTHRSEMAALKSDTERKFDAMMAELRAARNVPAPLPPPQPKGVNITELFAGLGGLLTMAAPLIASTLESSKAERQAREAREERAATERAAAMKEAAAAQAAMYERLATQSQASQSAFASMSEASTKMVQTFSQMALNQATAMMELQSQAGGEPGWVMAIREIAGPIGKIAAASYLASVPQSKQAALNHALSGQEAANEDPGQQGGSAALDAILERLQAHAPAPEVGAILFDAIRRKDADFINAAAAYQFNINTLMESALPEWIKVPANRSYFDNTSNWILSEGQRLGLFGASPQQPQPRTPAASRPLRAVQPPTANGAPANGAQRQPVASAQPPAGMEPAASTEDDGDEDEEEDAVLEDDVDGDGPAP